MVGAATWWRLDSGEFSMADTTTIPRTGNPFWTFSLDLYSSKEVQAACLELQDSSGVDVNVMLYLLWLASHGQALTDAETAGVLAVVDPWKTGVVVPLRTARRNLKLPPGAFDGNAAESLRNVVKKAELEAERLQQATLYALRQVGDRASPDRAAAAAASNLSSYGRALGRQLAQPPVAVMLASFKALLEKA